MLQIMGGVSRCLVAGAFAGALFAASAARASFIVTLQETGGPAIPVVDNGPLDADTLTPGVINVNTGALNLLLTNFTLTTLAASSNQSTGGGATPAFLTQTGSVARSNGVGTFSLTVNVADTGFLFPATDPKQMTTSASDTFAFTSAGSSRTFQSLFDPTNSTPPGAGTSSPLLVFIPPNGAGPFSTSNPGVITPLGAQPFPYGLSNTTVITLGAAQSGVNSTDQFTGSTSVTVVPEPAAAGQLLAVAGGLAMRRRRR